MPLKHAFFARASRFRWVAVPATTAASLIAPEAAAIVPGVYQSFKMPLTHSLASQHSRRVAWTFSSIPPGENVPNPSTDKYYAGVYDKTEGGLEATPEMKEAD